MSIGDSYLFPLQELSDCLLYIIKKACQGQKIEKFTNHVKYLQFFSMAEISLLWEMPNKMFFSNFHAMLCKAYIFSIKNNVPHGLTTTL